MEMEVAETEKDGCVDQTNIRDSTMGRWSFFRARWGVTLHSVYEHSTSRSLGCHRGTSAQCFEGLGGCPTLPF